MNLLFVFVLYVTLQFSLASHTEKRAAIGDVANVGFATQNGGTSGGSGGTTITVTNLTAFTTALNSSAKKLIVISGTITGNTVLKVGNNTSVIGARGSALVGVGLLVLNSRNVIIRNVKISKVLSGAGATAIGVQASSQVWLDHLDLSSDQDHDEDFYGNLLDITHGSSGITVSNCKIHDHWNTALVGDSDLNGAEDSLITVTYATNYWLNLGSSIPLIYYGRVHIFNNLFASNHDGVSTRNTAQLLVENNVWRDIDTQAPLYPINGGGIATVLGNDFGGYIIFPPRCPCPPCPPPPYSYTLLATTIVQASVTVNAGNSLAF